MIQQFKILLRQIKMQLYTGVAQRIQHRRDTIRKYNQKIIIQLFQQIQLIDIDHIQKLHIHPELHAFHEKINLLNRRIGHDHQLLPIASGQLVAIGKLSENQGQRSNLKMTQPGLISFLIVRDSAA